MDLRRAVGAPVIALLGGLAACDLPTETPLWDTEWDVVVLSDTVSTTDLLPDEMRVSGEGFVLDEFRSENHVRLGDVCELCTCFEGPIPEVELAPQEWPVRLPSGVLAARVVRGTADVVIHNEVGFDVLDDGEGNRGFLEVELVDSWTDEVYGDVRVEEPFPPGDSLELTFELPAVELSPRIVARVRGRTPGSGCDSVDLTPESGFRTTVSLRDVVSDSVDVLVRDADLAVPDRDFELPGWLVDRLRPGDAEVTLDVTVETSVPASFELGLSVAGEVERLFTGEAALFTPLILPAGGLDGVAVRKQFLLDLEKLRDAEHLFVSGETTVLGSRRVRLAGRERVAYTARLLARIPTR